MSDSDLKPPDAAVQLKYIDSLATRCSLIVTCHSLVGFQWESAKYLLIMFPVQSNLPAHDNLYLQPLPRASIPASAPPRVLRHYVLTRTGNPDPWQGQLTVGFALPGESNAASHLTRGGAQAVGDVSNGQWP